MSENAITKEDNIFVPANTSFTEGLSNFIGLPSTTEAWVAFGNKGTVTLAELIVIITTLFEFC